jgi:beta-lactam-binding protein with PASTA domain
VAVEQTVRFSGFINRLKTGWGLAVLAAELLLAFVALGGAAVWLDSQRVIEIPWLHRATVPDAISMPKAEARALLEEAELTANIICQDPQDKEAEPSTVYKMDPRPEAKVDPWSTVAIYVKPPCS